MFLAFYFSHSKIPHILYFAPFSVTCPQSHPALRTAVLAVLSELGLQATPRQLHKIDQLYEAVYQRMGVVLVGPSGAGKSTMLRVLSLALRRMGVEVTQYTMNPKATDRERLLGHMDPDTREWHDGVLTNSAKKIMQAAETAGANGGGSGTSTAAATGSGVAEQRSWVVCDGDVDPEWVESLNSVLDDNHLLTMPNGVRSLTSNNSLTLFILIVCFDSCLTLTSIEFSIITLMCMFSIVFYISFA